MWEEPHDLGSSCLCPQTPDQQKNLRNNFRNKHVNQTYLCYEVEVWRRNAWAPMEEHQGILSNLESRRRHAELCFLDRVRSWRLDRTKHYRLTWHVSWSPRPVCAPELAAFLRENSHVSLRIFAAGIHTTFSGYERGLRDLRDAGAQLAIMTLEGQQETPEGGRGAGTEAGEWLHRGGRRRMGWGRLSAACRGWSLLEERVQGTEGSWEGRAPALLGNLRGQQTSHSSPGLNWMNKYESSVRYCRTFSG
ncbi:hypothetical protein QTO34_018038 [Cnephaeus nilssonii]|uniref:Uncharacterized protein n=1 Tax=Cnephaeus nilssonii TaxID=3371016 RepID=A0AA40LRT7_CNENI|nr:hypothetical protein QTO34_018038 [Eptesicus nilssonii]